MRPTRSRTTALAAVAATLVAPAVALGDRPTFTIAADFTSGDAHGISIPTLASMTAEGGTPGGAWATLGWCTPWVNTEVVGFNYHAARWHNSLGNDAVLQEDTSNGTVEFRADSSLPYRVINGFGPGTGSYAMAPSACFGVKMVARARLATAAAWTLDLNTVEVRDLQGPAVRDVWVPGDWQTGERMPFSVVTSDNDFNRGPASVQIDGGPETPPSDPPNGYLPADTDIRGLADGTHTFTVIRRANGWADAAGSATFRVDHNPPSAPVVVVGDSNWTNAAGVLVHSTPTGDGTGSGWNRNQFQIDGGEWIDSPTDFPFSSAGSHAIRARAVDAAGHVSAPSDPASIRIDRTPPAVPVPAMSFSGGDTLRIRASATDQGGSGLGRAVIEMRNATGSSVVSLLSGSAASLQDGHDFTVPMAQMPAGAYTVIIQVTDGAGNETRKTSFVSWTPPAPPAASKAPTPASPGAATKGAAPATGGPASAGAPASTAGKDGRDGRDGRDGSAATTTATTAATTARRNAAALRWWRPVVVRGRVGTRAQLRGRLMAGRQAVPAGTRVRVRDSAGIIVASGRVRQDGGLVLRVPVRAREAVTVLRTTGGAGVRVQVRPVAR